MKKKILAPVLALLVAVMFLMPSAALAGTIKVAVAANFTQPITDLIRDYNLYVEDSVTIECVFDSTGNLAKTIRGQNSSGIADPNVVNPYHLFFSADDSTPAALFTEGLVAAPVPYVHGALVGWTNKSVPDTETAFTTTTGREGLTAASVAVADPKLAPYGVAAKETFIKLGMWTVDANWEDVNIDKAIIQPVTTYTNITNAYKAVTEGNASYTFVAKSQVYYNGVYSGTSHWAVPAADYSDIVQAAAIVYKDGVNAEAQAFLNWVLTDTVYAQPILLQYGYVMP